MPPSDSLGGICLSADVGASASAPGAASFLGGSFRSAFRGPVILAGGYLKDNGQAAIDAGEADLIGMGKPFLANPDLVERLRNDWPLNAWNSRTFYTEGPIGYIDYPSCVNESVRPQAVLKIDGM